LAVQDFSQQPPAQELIARDLHDVEWKFRHIFRGKVLFLCCFNSYYLAFYGTSSTKLKRITTRICVLSIVMICYFIHPPYVHPDLALCITKTTITIQKLKPFLFAKVAIDGNENKMYLLH